MENHKTPVFKGMQTQSLDPIVMSGNQDLAFKINENESPFYCQKFPLYYLIFPTDKICNGNDKNVA